MLLKCLYTGRPCGRNLQLTPLTCQQRRQSGASLPQHGKSIDVAAGVPCAGYSDFPFLREAIRPTMLVAKVTIPVNRVTTLLVEVNAAAVASLWMLRT